MKIMSVRASKEKIGGGAVIVCSGSCKALHFISKSSFVKTSVQVSYYTSKFKFDLSSLLV